MTLTKAPASFFTVLTRQKPCLVRNKRGSRSTILESSPKKPSELKACTHKKWPVDRAKRSTGCPRKMPLVGQRRPALPRTHSAVPSALGGLTSGFGMGPGVPPPPWSLTNEGHSAVRGRPGRALRAAQRATGSRDRARRRVTHRHLGSRVMEELGLLVTLG